MKKIYYTVGKVSWESTSLVELLGLVGVFLHPRWIELQGNADVASSVTLVMLKEQTFES